MAFNLNHLLFRNNKFDWWWITRGREFHEITDALLTDIIYSILVILQNVHKNKIYTIQLHELVSVSVLPVYNKYTAELVCSKPSTFARNADTKLSISKKYRRQGDTEKNRPLASVREPVAKYCTRRVVKQLRCCERFDDDSIINSLLTLKVKENFTNLQASF